MAQITACAHIILGRLYRLPPEAPAANPEELSWVEAAISDLLDASAADPRARQLAEQARHALLEVRRLSLRRPGAPFHPGAATIEAYRDAYEVAAQALIRLLERPK